MQAEPSAGYDEDVAVVERIGQFGQPAMKCPADTSCGLSALNSCTEASAAPLNSIQGCPRTCRPWGSALKVDAFLRCGVSLFVLTRFGRAVVDINGCVGADSVGVVAVVTDCALSVSVFGGGCCLGS